MVKLKMLSSALMASLVLAVPHPASAQKVAGLALPPPMGWNSWNHYGCNIDGALIKQSPTS